MPEITSRPKQVGFFLSVRATPVSTEIPADISHGFGFCQASFLLGWSGFPGGGSLDVEKQTRISV
jgi:hypothetical protein